MKNSSKKASRPRIADRPQPGSVVEDALSGRLRAYYAEVEKQQVPQNLLDLLDELDRSSPATS